MNGVQVFDEEVANRLLREARGRVVLTIYRKRRAGAPQQQQNPRDRDDMTEIDGFSSSGDELDVDEFDVIEELASEGETTDHEMGISPYSC